MSRFKVGDRVRILRPGYEGAEVSVVATRGLYPVGNILVESKSGARVSFRPESLELVESTSTPFATRVEATLGAIGEMLVEKNKAYGNSALDPVRVFSTGSAAESLAQRLDDKISRVARGAEYPGDDTIVDLIGYLVLYKMAKEDEQ